MDDQVRFQQVASAGRKQPALYYAVQFSQFADLQQTARIEPQRSYHVAGVTALGQQAAFVSQFSVSLNGALLCDEETSRKRASLLNKRVLLELPRAQSSCSTEACNLPVSVLSREFSVMVWCTVTIP